MKPARNIALLGALILSSVTFMAQGLNGQGFLVDVKCSKCHTLERVFIICKSEGEWRDVIEKMMGKNPEWIRPGEAEQVLKEILSLYPDRVHEMCRTRKHYENVRLLFLDRCTVCHNINRVLFEDRTRHEWGETVRRMYSEAMGFITEEEAAQIAHFLSETGHLLKEEAGGRVFVAKCLNCHPGEEILMETHDSAGWGKQVERCRETACRTFNTNWLDPAEARLIVDLLVKTQGEGR